MKYKKELLYTDEKTKLVSIKRLKESAEYLNKFLEVCENSLKRELTSAEKLEIYEKGINPLMNRLKKDFIHKNAEDSLNWSILGIDNQSIISFYESYNSVWQGIEQVLNENGKFNPINIDKNPNISRYSYYTESIEQNEALKHARKLSKALNEVPNKYFPFKRHYEVEDTIQIVEYVNGKYQPDGVYISRL